MTNTTINKAIEMMMKVKTIAIPMMMMILAMKIVIMMLTTKNFNDDGNDKMMANPMMTMMTLVMIMTMVLMLMPILMTMMMMMMGTIKMMKIWTKMTVLMMMIQTITRAIPIMILMTTVQTNHHATSSRGLGSLIGDLEMKIGRIALFLVYYLSTVCGL